MSIDFAASVLSFEIFAIIVYVANFKRLNGRLPKLRNPFV